MEFWYNKREFAEIDNFFRANQMFSEYKTVGA